MNQTGGKTFATLVFFDGKSSLTKAPFIMVLPVVQISVSVHAENPIVNLCVIFYD